jgi:hypothetical protein
MLAVEPLSVLTGASGTGKTSLLRASVIPNLIGGGWCAVYSYPLSDPTEALKSELLAQALPDPRAECDLVNRLMGEGGATSGSGLQLDSS